MRRRILLLGVFVFMLVCCGEHPAAAENVFVNPVQVDTYSSLQRNLARWYNVNLTSDTPETGFQQAYSSILWYEGGVMGYVKIPSLELIVPVYHDGGSGGFVHDSRTAFPIGGCGNNTVLTIGKSIALSEGERVEIRILGDTLYYSIGQPGTDTCTLICDGTEYICGRIWKE